MADLDTDTLTRAIAAQKRRFLDRFGAGVLATARGSIRHGGRPSRPGSPPTSRSGELPKGMGYAVEGDAVVVGFTARRPGSKVPAVLEHGGRVEGRDYRARPTMGPAFRAEIQSRLATHLRSTAIG